MMALTRVHLILGAKYLAALLVVDIVQRMLTWLERLLRRRRQTHDGRW